MTRFAIHLETGVVVAITPETKGNYLYQEIKPKVAMAIRDGKVTPQWVIDQIVAKMPRTTLREKVALEGVLNVRTIDFGLREAARASADLGEDRSIDIDLPEKKPTKKAGGKTAGKGGKKEPKKDEQEKPGETKDEQEEPGETIDVDLPGDDGGESGGDQPSEGKDGGEVVV